MQRSFSHQQSPSSNKFPLSSSNTKITSPIHATNPSSRQQQILQRLHSENAFKIRSFKQSFSMLSDIQTIQFQDGSRYDGQVVGDGVRHGIGIFSSADGDEYLGDWEEDRYHGYGLYVYQDGERYEGELGEGVKEGEGKYFYQDGRVYEGEWRNDQREGQGTEQDLIKGVYYQGQWSNDQKQGQGKMYLLADEIPHPSQQPIILLEGNWSKDIFTQGNINSEVYQGQFRNMTLTGKGVYKFPDGSVYNGQFYNNLFHGQGIYYYSNGDVYEGGFACGLKSGSGVYKYFSGDVYDGEYEKDLKSGEGKFIFVNGNFYIGQFQKDSFHGNGKYFFHQNQSITGTWSYGKLLQNNKEMKILAQNNTISANSLQNSSSINKTPNKSLRNPSPIRYPFSTQQIHSNKSLSPFSHQKSHLINTERNQKASVIHINPNKSPIKNSKFIDVHTPSDSYFKQGSFILPSGQQLSQFSTSKQKPSYSQAQFSEDHSNVMNSKQKSQFKDVNVQQENENEMKFKKLVTKQYPAEMNSDKKVESKNMFNFMNGGVEEEHNSKVVPSLLYNQQNSLQKGQQQQVPKKSKRKLQY